MFMTINYSIVKIKCVGDRRILKASVISHFPKKYGCSKNRFHNGAVLLLFIFEQTEPAFFFVKIPSFGQSKQPIKGKMFHRSSELWS